MGDMEIVRQFNSEVSMRLLNCLFKWKSLSLTCSQELLLVIITDLSSSNMQTFHPHCSCRQSMKLSHLFRKQKLLQLPGLLLKPSRYALSFIWISCAKNENGVFRVLICVIVLVAVLQTRGAKHREVCAKSKFQQLFCCHF